MNPSTIGSCLAVGALVVLSHLANAQDAACRDAPVYRALDFWLGDWRVTSSDGVEQGRNRIHTTLDGCAVLENWTDTAGGQGMSVFYVWGGEWRQVWVTQSALRPGGVKEKRELERLPGGGIRFQGEITLPGGESYLDRTSLSPLDGGTVRQLIETSSDGGASWQVTFEGIYRRE